MDGSGQRVKFVGALKLQRNRVHKALVGSFSRTGTSVYDGARKLNNWFDQWQSGKLGTGSRVKSFPRAFPSSNDVPVLLLNQPSVRNGDPSQELNLP